MKRRPPRDRAVESPADDLVRVPVSARLRNLFCVFVNYLAFMLIR